MDHIMETLSITFSLVALFFIPFALCTIIYLIKRNRLNVSANCWFCNSWTKVLYSNRNSFYCPSCHQYNGFGEDGGYNKVIEAQYDTSFNKYNKTTRKTEPLSNGLCTYCNNNQQLKVYQLAHFVPLNEKNYDVEVEHFEKQLEKAYKLCKKCDKVLKTTIDGQHAWMFGNRLKSLQRKTSVLNSNKTPKRIYIRVKQSFYINIVRYLLILFSIFILCQCLDVKIYYGNVELKNYVPDIFVPYTMLFSDLYSSITNTSSIINTDINALNSYLPKTIKLIANDLLPVTCAGFFLEIILLFGGLQPFWWKVNETLGWTILVISSLIKFQDQHSVYIKTLQVFCSIGIICSLLTTSNAKRKRAFKKFEFKKLRRNDDDSDSSDDDNEISDEAFSSSLSSKKSFIDNAFKGKNGLNATFCQSPHTFPQGSVFQNNMQDASKLNNSFATARSTKSTSVFNSSSKNACCSFKNASNKSYSSELHHSLDNLHLGNLNLKPQMCTSPVFSFNSVNRPILSPPKLKNVTQNSWTAGGFWKNDTTLYPASTDFVNLSRSSSQSSGFVSNNEPLNPNRFNSLPSSREPSVCDFERSSILSEPAYHFKPIHSSHSKASKSKNSFDYNSLQSPRVASPTSGQLYYKAENNTFYPVLNQNNMLLIQGANIPSHNFANSFSSLSLRSFNTNNNNFNTPVLFGQPPVISSLFKNLPEFNMQSHCFRAPHC